MVTVICCVFAFVVCGRKIEELGTEIRSPNYPSTPYITPDQHDENPRCYWNMRPAESSVSAIWITFEDFLLGRREVWGGCRYILALICKHDFVLEFSRIFRHQQVLQLMLMSRYIVRLSISNINVKSNRKLQIIV